MESSRREGLPPAYEDADIDALCQLIGTYYEAIIFAPDKGRLTLIVLNSAHARPLDIHQRPYPTLTVCFSPLSLFLGRIADLHPYFVDFFFLRGRGRVYHLDPMINRTPPQREHLAFPLRICTADLHPRVSQAYRTLHQPRSVCPILSPLPSTHFSLSRSPSFFFINESRN